MASDRKHWRSQSRLLVVYLSLSSAILSAQLMVLFLRNLNTINMKKITFLLFCILSHHLFAQNADSFLQASHVVVHKDSRLEILGEKQAEINLLAIKMATRTAMGYRLQVLSTNDRELALRTKTQLLQTFPEQKTYMFFQLPYVKLRFGNFKTKQEAEPYRKRISKMLDGASIYYVAERIEVKPEKELMEEEQ